MIICVCNGVTEREIQRTVRCGASTLDEVARRCGAGSGCGGCRFLVSTILEEERGRAALSSESFPASDRPSPDTPSAWPKRLIRFFSTRPHSRPVST